MKLDRPLVLATRNAGKIYEFRQLLDDFEIEIKSLNDFGPIPLVEEDGNTFEDNAYKKAHFTARFLGLPALADDSGLLVNALAGMPGIQSARYAGEGATDEINNLKLLEAMKTVVERSASFVCVIALAVPAGPALIYEGRCDGRIATEQQGKGGFGYDPLFYFPPLKRTFAQMTAEEKNRVSHRGKAMTELRNEFGKVLIWLGQRLAEARF